MVEFFTALFSNKILQSFLFAYIAASAIKVFIRLLRYKRFQPGYFFRTGGMPSSHSAVAGAMSAAVYMSEGLSNLFVVSMIVSLVIISDALGIRRAAGKQAELLNMVALELQRFG